MGLVLTTYMSDQRAKRRVEAGKCVRLAAIDTAHLPACSACAA